MLFLLRSHNEHKQSRESKIIEAVFGTHYLNCSRLLPFSTAGLSVLAMPH